MKTRFFSLSFLAFAVLGLAGLASAREVVLPAGTLLNCVMDEPNFSSATASIGDPFLCHPRSIQMFGQSVFPRGAYLVGHLEDDKDPGHFVGKGRLKLSFDRIGLANTDLPLPAKVIAVKGYKVDREGNIIGHGHPTRDTVEWLLPPLWPWKVLTLPARGPRPALKGETRVTLRLMDDVTVPLPDGPTRSPFGERQGTLVKPKRPRFFSRSRPESPARYSPPPRSSRPASPATESVAQVRELAVVTTAQPEDSGWRYFGPPRTATNTKTTLFAMKEGTVLAVSSYQRDNDTLSYVLTSGTPGTLELRDVDWATTTRLNQERGVRVTLRNAAVYH